MIKSIIGTLFLLICFSCSKRAEKDSAQLEALYQKIYPLFDTNLDSALLLADSSLLLAQKNDHTINAAHSYYIKGHIYDLQGDLSNAFVSYLKSISICQKLGTDAAKKKFVKISANISRILTKHYKYEEALEVTQNAYTKAQELDLKSQQQKLTYNMAHIHWKSGELDKALYSLKESVDIAHSLKDTTRLIKCFMLFGVIHKDGKQYQEARNYYQYILNHPKALLKDIRSAYHNIAASYMDEGALDSAKAYYVRSLEIMDESVTSSIKFASLHDLGEWHLSHGSIDSARFYGEQAAALYPQLIREPETFKVFQLLRKVTFAQQDFTYANQMADRAEDEAQLFHETVENIMKERDQFQIDLILSGMHAEEAAGEAQRSSQRYRWITIIGGILAILSIVGWKIWFKRWRTNLWNKIYGLVHNIHADRPYRDVPFDGL